MRCLLHTLSALFVVALARGEETSHWAFQPIAPQPVPAVEDSGWTQNPIDHFVLSQLQEAELEPSPLAPPHTLLRRLYLDLTGLLPTADDVREFQQAWSHDPDAAYASQVDRLLESPHFGEHWARQWLDLARYADSDGYLGDSIRPWAWIYRDWVIEAINQDMPFDQFSIEQLAGDLLPSPSQGQLIATGFHRNNLKNTEAGSDAELNRTKQVVDRVATTGTVWLGLTLGCAECHDHKHDPVSQEEFFQLFAFFNNSNDADVSVRLEEEWNAYADKLSAWEATLAKLEAPLAGVPRRSPSPSPPPGNRWHPIVVDQATAAGTDLEIQEDHSILATGKTPTTVTYFAEAPVGETVTTTGFQLEVVGEFGEGRESGKPVGRGKNGQFVLSTFVVDLIENGKPRRLKFRAAKADHGDTPEKALDTSTTEGWQVSTRTYETHLLQVELEEPLQLPKGSRLKFSLGQKQGSENLIRHLKLSRTSDPAPLEPWVETVNPEWAKLRTAVEAHLASAPDKPSTKAQTLVERGPKDQRETYVHIRGDYTRRGDQVSPNTPAILHPLTLHSERGTPNRLTLAHWLFADANPLTARVVVNQIWQQLFGVGIVSTSDDFGTHGAPPTHPELLDWLASEFRRHGWSRKELIRTIVHSSTYQQASTNRYPEIPNQLLWRQNSYRVEAETIRDAHLVASGLFEPKVGGPGIRPPLPGFVTEVGRSVKWPVSDAPDRYRRGLYIVLKRTVLYPMLTTFDAPDTSVACSRRERTNTPMQALTLLNDPVFFECAETLGKQVYAKVGDDPQKAVRELFLRCLNRPPEPQETQVLASAYQDFKRLSEQPELAMVATARIVMNLDEFVTRD